MVLNQEVEDGDKAILHEELLVLGDWAQSSSCMWAIQKSVLCTMLRVVSKTNCFTLSFSTVIDIINRSTLRLVFLSPPLARALGTNPTISSDGFIRLSTTIGVCAKDTTLGSGRRLSLCCVHDMSDLKPHLGIGISDEMLI